MELGESIPDDELREMVDEADRDQDGFVVFEDFYRIMKKPSDDDVSGVFTGKGPLLFYFTTFPLSGTPTLPRERATRKLLTPHYTHKPKLLFCAIQDDEDD